MRKKSRDPVFGEKGTVSVEWTGELPSPALGPYYTRKIYRFRTDKNPRLVDKRDLPQLVKEAGRENLRGLPAEPRPKPKPKAKAKPKKSEVKSGEISDDRNTRHLRQAE